MGPLQSKLAGLWAYMFLRRQGQPNPVPIVSLGAQRSINFNEEDFVPILREIGGANIILDIIGGDYVARNIRAAHADAKIIQLAFNLGSKIEVDLMPHYAKASHPEPVLH